jgi:hypothetical protein
MLLIFALVISAAAGANLTNLTPDTTESSGEPLFMVDPIGNHAIGDIFFINGTTNLPVSENLTLHILDYFWLIGPKTKSKSYPLPSGRYVFISNIPISSATSGLNRWSVNVTDNVKELVSNEYIVWVCNPPGCVYIPDTEKTQIFTLLPANKSLKFNNPQTTPQSPSPVQPTTGATIVPPIESPSPIMTTVPTTPPESPGYDTLITVAGLCIITLIVIRRH